MIKRHDMVRIRLRYVVEDIDRNGNVRRYFRRKGHQKVRLLGLPGSDEFMAAYRTALSGAEEIKRQYQRAPRGIFRLRMPTLLRQPNLQNVRPEYANLAPAGARLYLPAGWAQTYRANETQAYSQAQRRTDR